MRLLTSVALVIAAAAHAGEIIIDPHDPTTPGGGGTPPDDPSLAFVLVDALALFLGQVLLAALGIAFAVGAVRWAYWRIRAYLW